MRWFSRRTLQQSEDLSEERTNSLVTMRKFKDASYVAFVLLILTLGVETVILMPRVLRLFDGMEGTLQGMQKTTNATAQQVAGLSETLGGVAPLLEKTAMSIQNTSLSVQGTLNHANRVMDNMSDLEKNLNVQINQGALPEFTENLNELKKTQRSLQEVMSETKSTVGIFNSETLPIFNQELEELKKTNEQATLATVQLKEGLGHANNIVAHYDKVINTKKGRLSLLGHFGISFLEQVTADIVALKATGH